jgi:hypothetical protein
MTDVRENLPSSSSRARDQRCPGALNFIRALRESGVVLDDGNKPWTESGTRIHAAVAGEEIDLEHDEESAKEIVQARLQRLHEDLGAPSDAAEIKEDRMWLRDGMRKIASGQPDIVWIYGDIAVIPDVKTGWLNAEREDVNPQLRSYAVLVWLNIPGIHRVIVALAQAHGKKPHPVGYDEGALRLAEEEWRAEIDACNQPDAPRVAGDKQCKYCPAAPHCEKANALVDSMALTVRGREITGITDSELSGMLDLCKPVKDQINKIEAEAKRRKEANPDCLPDWELVPGKVAHPIIDLVTVFNRCTDHGITPEKFTEACSITKKSLTEALKTATGKKGKALDDIVKQVVEGATIDKPSAAQLKRKS